MLVLSYLSEWESLNPLHGVHIEDVNRVFTVHGQVGGIVAWEEEERAVCRLLLTIHKSQIFHFLLHMVSQTMTPLTRLQNSIDSK